MNTAQIKTIIDFIDKYDNFLLFGHEDPDADSICSMLVFSAFLIDRGKESTVYAQLPFTRKELQTLAPLCRGKVDSSSLKGSTAVFLIDCSTPERTGPFADTAGRFPCAVIDHHDSGEINGGAGIIEPEAPSATALVLDFLLANNFTPDREQSQLLLLGLCTDTGFFRHVSAGESGAFKAAAKLCELGASPNSAYYTIYGSRSPGSRIFLATIFSRMQFRFDGKLLTVYEKLSDLQLFAAEDRDKDVMYQLLLGTEGVVVTAYFKEEENSRCSVSLRTREEIDLSLAASDLGGGGHKKASGYTVESSIENAIESFIKYAEEKIFSNL